MTRIPFFTFLVLLLGSGTAMFAQDPPAAAAGNGIPAAADAGQRDPSQEALLREQTIYIPYTRLRSLFEKEGRGVFLPYEKFQELWRAARAAQVPPHEQKPPVGALISEIASQAEVQGDVMLVTSTLTIELMSEGWHEIGLRLRDAAIRSARLGEQPARIVWSPESGYRLLIEHRAADPSQVTLQLQYSKAFSTAPGTNSVSFDAPQAPINRWQIRIPEPGVRVDVHPTLAATAADQAAAGDSPVDLEKETVVQAFVGAADQVRIDWTAKAEGAAGLAAMVHVQAQQETVVDEGVVRTRIRLAYEITRSDVTQLTIEAPSDHQVVNVFDPNVQRWENQIDGDRQTLTVTLFQPTRGLQNLSIELEKFAGDREMPREMMEAEIQVPVIRALQAGTPDAMVAVGRQQGLVVTRLGASLRGEVTSRSGLLQIDTAELPPPLAGQDWTFAYRYAALPFGLHLRVEKLSPQVEADELVEVFLEPNELTTSMLALLDVQRAGIFQIQLQIPAGYEVRRVEGRDVAGAAAVAVDAYHVQAPADADGQPLLVVGLAKRAMGRVALWVELSRRLDDANLQQPTGATSVLDVPLPRVVPSSVVRTNGRVLLYAPESLRINPQETAGLRTTSTGEALAGVESMRGSRFGELRPVAAYGYSLEATRLVIEAQRRKPYIEARQMLAVHVDSGVVRYDTTFFYDIRYSSVSSLRLDVPESIASEVRNLTPNLREQVIEPPPEDLAEGYVAWRLAGEGELLGSVRIDLRWEKKLGELPVGRAVDIDLPQLKAVEVDRFWGQITASKTETIEISVEGDPKGLRPIDPQRDLMPGVSIENAARAFEFHEDWTLQLQATRYELEDVKRTSIESALVRMVVTRGDEVAVQAIYRLRSARQRLAVRLPGVNPNDTASSLDSQPLRINQQPAPLEHDGTLFYIPLTNLSADDDVLVELRYTVSGTAAELALPQFPEDPAVQQVHLAVYLPEEWTVLATRGPWTDESNTIWIDRPWRKEGPPDRRLIQTLASGIVGSTTLGDDFPLDGKRHLFSALRPEDAPEGAMRITTAHRNVVNGLVFLLVAAVGLVLTPRSAALRLWWLAALVVAIVIAAVFAPALARALLGPPLYLALALVLLVWTVRCLAWLIPGLVRWLNDRFTTHTATAAVGAGTTTAAGTGSPATAAEAEKRQAGESPPPADPDSQDAEGGRQDV